MEEVQRWKMEWHLHQALANLANGGVLSIARSAERALRLIHSGTTEGLSGIERVAFRRRKKKTKQQTEHGLADRAKDGVLSVARSTGKALRVVHSGTTDGLSKIGQVPLGRRKRKIKRQTEPLEAVSLPEAAGPEAAAEATPGETPSLAKGEAAEPAEGEAGPVTEEERPGYEEMEQEGPQYPLLDLEALLKEHSPRDRVEAIRFRKALDDLLHGSQAARRGALKTLVGLGQVAEPFLVASLQIASPQVVEIALEGLSQIGSQRLIGCISDVLASSDSELRIVALRAAQRLTDDEARPFLTRGLQDPSARVKRRVLSYLSWHDSSWALAEIVRLCDDREPDVRWAALEILLALRPSDACDNLELMIPSLDPADRRRAATLLERRKRLLDEDSTTQTPDAPDVQVSSTPDVGEEAKETGPGENDIQESVDAHSSEGVLSEEMEEKESEQPSPTSEVEERAPTDETLEERGSFPPGATTESGAD